MEMPVVVGVILAIIFLVAFSEWFYHLVEGWNELVIDDIYFKYRIVGVSIVSIFLICSTFFVMALVNECPNEERSGVFANLRCEEYMKIKVGTDRFFSKENI